MIEHFAYARSVPREVLPGLLDRRRQGSHSWLLLSLALSLVVAMTMSACSSANKAEAVGMTYDSYFASFVYDYNPASDIGELSRMSSVVSIATLVDVQDGRIFGDRADGHGGRHLNLVFETENETRYYVQLPRPSSSSIDQLRSVLPIGQRSVIYLVPNSDPDDGVWFNKRDDNNEWFFTTPQGWILDHSHRGIVFPLEHEEPFQTVPVVTDTLENWYVPK